MLCSRLLSSEVSSEGRRLLSSLTTSENLARVSSTPFLSLLMLSGELARIVGLLKYLWSPQNSL